MSLSLQFCGRCGTAQYPSRDVCRRCLSGDLNPQTVPVRGTVVSEATIHRSLDPARLVEGPLRIGAVASALGIRLIAVLGPGTGAGATVDLSPCPRWPGAIVASAASEDQKS